MNLWKNMNEWIEILGIHVTYIFSMIIDSKNNSTIQLKFLYTACHRKAMHKFLKVSFQSIFLDVFSKQMSKVNNIFCSEKS